MKIASLNFARLGQTGHKFNAFSDCAWRCDLQRAALRNSSRRSGAILRRATSFPIGAAEARHPVTHPAQH